jgi:hypothetical protein
MMKEFFTGMLKVTGGILLAYFLIMASNFGWTYVMANKKDTTDTGKGGNGNGNGASNGEPGTKD